MFLWRTEVDGIKERKRRRELQRVVRSLQIISLPAGDAGIIDVDIKVNYTENLLGCLTDSIVTKNTLLNS